MKGEQEFAKLKEKGEREIQAERVALAKVGSTKVLGIFRYGEKLGEAMCRLLGK